MVNVNCDNFIAKSNIVTDYTFDGMQTLKTNVLSYLDGSFFHQGGVRVYKKEIFLEIDTNLHQPIQSMEADSNSRRIRFYLFSTSRSIIQTKQII